MSSKSITPGLHGQLGAAAAGPVVLEEPQDIVSACLPQLPGGNPVQEGAKNTKIVKLGNAPVSKRLS